MRVGIYGTRGSLATPGAETQRYGGNTACVRVTGADGAELALDAGTGLRRLGLDFPKHVKRVDLLLTHLHMDHIQGLGFFGPLYDPTMEVHIWGPASPTLTLDTRLTRYLSPPLFPVRLRDVACRLELHHVPCGRFSVRGFQIEASWVCHPGPTVGYRVEADGASMAYLPDHEPALGARGFPSSPEWTSGHDLAAGVDLLLHDAQYTPAEYAAKVGWGHSSTTDAVAFAIQAGARRLALFHHDPGRDDVALDAALAAAQAEAAGLSVVAAAEGTVHELA